MMARGGKGDALTSRALVRAAARQMFRWTARGGTLGIALYVALMPLASVLQNQGFSLGELPDLLGGTVAILVVGVIAGLLFALPTSLFNAALAAALTYLALGRKLTPRAYLRLVGAPLVTLDVLLLWAAMASFDMRGESPWGALELPLLLGLVAGWSSLRLGRWYTAVARERAEWLALLELGYNPEAGG